MKEKDELNLSTPSELILKYSIIPARLKLSFLVEFIKRNQKSKIAVYFMTCNQVDYFHAIMRQLVSLPVIKVKNLDFINCKK